MEKKPEGRAPTPTTSFKIRTLVSHYRLLYSESRTMEKHVSKRLDECDNKKVEHGDDDDEGEEPTEAILRAICNKYSNGDEEAAVLKKERTDAWNSFKEKSGMIRKEEEAGGSNGMGVKMLRSFSRKEFVGATKPPLQGLRLRNNHQNSDPETAPVVGRPPPQTSDQTTIHTDDEIRDDNPSELMAVAGMRNMKIRVVHRRVVHIPTWDTTGEACCHCEGGELEDWIDPEDSDSHGVSLVVDLVCATGCVP
eukprot:scaffold918_cov126-Cylindrotheca_fusiformis.AAC.86